MWPPADVPLTRTQQLRWQLSKDVWALAHYHGISEAEILADVRDGLELHNDNVAREHAARARAASRPAGNVIAFRPPSDLR